jgi:hypothetical protein
MLSGSSQRPAAVDCPSCVSSNACGGEPVRVRICSGIFQFECSSSTPFSRKRCCDKVIVRAPAASQAAATLTTGKPACSVQPAAIAPTSLPLA